MDPNTGGDEDDSQDEQDKHLDTRVQVSQDHGEDQPGEPLQTLRHHQTSYDGKDDNFHTIHGAHFLKLSCTQHNLTNILLYFQMSKFLVCVQLTCLQQWNSCSQLLYQA